MRRLFSLPAVRLTLPVVLSLAAVEASAATITTAGPGAWSAGSTWVGGVAPAATDDVIIEHAVTLDGNATINDVTIQVGSLDLNGNALWVSGDFALVSGTFTAPGFSEVRFVGSGAQTITGSPDFALLTIVNTAPTPGDADAVVASSAITAASLSISDGQFMPASGTSLGYLTLSANGILKPATGATINLTSAASSQTFQGSGTFIANGSLFRLTGSGEQNVSSAVTFHNLEVANTAAVPDDSNDAFIGGGTTIAGSLQVTSGQVTVFGQLNDATVGAAGILKLATGARIAGDLTNTLGGQVVGRTGEYITFNGSGPQVISGPATLQGVTFENTAAVPDDTNSISTTGGLTTLRNINVVDGQFTPTTGDVFANIFVSGAGILKPASGSTVEVSGELGGTAFQVSGGSVVPNGSTFLFTSPTGGAVYGATLHNVEIDNGVATPGDSNDHEIGGGTVVAGTLTLTDGQANVYGTVTNVTVGADTTLKLTSGAHVKGNITNTSGGTATSPTGSFITFSGNGPQHLSGPITLAGVSIENTATTPDDSNAVTTSGQLTVTQVINVTDGQFTPATGDKLNSVYVLSGGILKPAAGGLIELTGAYNSSLSLRVDAGGSFLHNGSKFRIATSSASGLIGASFHDLEIASSAAVPGDANAVSLGGLSAVENLTHVVSGQFIPYSPVHDVQIESGAIMKVWGTATITGDLLSTGTIVANAPSANIVFDGGTLQNFTSSTAATLPQLTIGAGTILNENGPADSTSGAITNNGTLRRTRTAALGTITGGLTGATVEVTTLGTLSTIAIDRIASVPNAGPGHEGTASWTFDVAGATGYTVGLTLPHANATPANAAVARYLGTGTSWQYVQTSSTAGTVTRNGITDLSSVWAVADFTMTSVADWSVLED